MGRIIDRRRVMGGKLHYDAEVDYLETTGTQYINPNIYPSPNYVKVETKFTVSELKSFATVCGFLRYNNYSQYSFKISRFGSNDEMRLQYKDHLGSRVCGYSLGSTYIIDAGLIGNTIYCDVNGERTFTNTITENNIYTGYPILIFVASDARTGGMAKIDEAAIIQLYYFKIYNSNGLVFDAIPVRVGQVGYLYDKVSKQLFGNSGTGAFILGPDK